ncbi:nuclear transport factor 2 family protein [Hyphomonas johnsonii]|jgi:hypothetical protein|uniref:SnoaL-like domain-containing protein n=1 Tax=Hyphomonas johnsonii MHS-2 TaxID=1280950 RepID=A0A059FN71_9PROT|nr:nuclear transport factor 2 family protein [Hyphomonas johnsonii]KCZ92125.1 hypothetical protein HJO_08824 [Hyphomonas johnsonii MHS-2]
MIDRDQIEAALRRLNEAENARPSTGVEAVSAKIDMIMAPDVEGWRNGVHVPDRATEREVERKAFGALTDYNRTIERTIIDPPLASTGWTIHGTFEGREVRAAGSSIFEFNDAGRVQKYWMYFNPEDFFYRSR